MCTSLVWNGNRTLAGFNLDILGFPWRVTTHAEFAAIELYDAAEGWMPLFGANARGEFVGMPTCWPADIRSNPSDQQDVNVINLDIDLLLQKKSFSEVRAIAEAGRVSSVPDLTFQAQLSDAGGNVLVIVPGQGTRFLERPRFSVLTNFSPYKMDAETHPWMGMDRYLKANRVLSEAPDEWGVENCFELLQAVAQSVCPTEVSMVFDVAARTVHWCEKQNFGKVRSWRFDR